MILQLRLPPDAFERLGVDVLVHISGDRHGAFLLRVAKLTMTSPNAIDAPTIPPQYPQDIPDLHASYDSMGGRVSDIVRWF
jgi:hypothetical protein